MALGDASVKRRGTSGVYVEGIEKTMKALRKLDTELFKASVETIQIPLQAAASLARSKYPADNQALSGWSRRPAKTPIPPRSFPPYRLTSAQKGVKVVVNKRTGKAAKSYKIGALIQTNAGGVIFDIVRNSPNNFGSDLVAKHGGPSRIMWPSMRAMQSSIVAAIKMAQSQAELVIQTLMSDRSVMD